MVFGEAGAGHGPPGGQIGAGQAQQHLQDVRVGPQPGIVAIGGDEGGASRICTARVVRRPMRRPWVPALGLSVSQTPSAAPPPPAGPLGQQEGLDRLLQALLVGLGGGDHRLPFGVDGAALLQHRFLFGGAGRLGLLFQLCRTPRRNCRPCRPGSAP